MSNEAAREDKYQGLDNEALVDIYRTMYTSRRIDDKEINLKGTEQDFLSDQRRRTRGNPHRSRTRDEVGL